MRWFFKASVGDCSNPRIYQLFYVFSLDLPSILIYATATTQFYPPTWASPVSATLSLSTTLVHSPTWASIVSIPACRLPTLSYFSLPVPVPTTCPSPHRYYSSLYLPVSLPGCPEVVFMLPLDTTTHPYCTPLHRNLSPLDTPKIRD